MPGSAPRIVSLVVALLSAGLVTVDRQTLQSSSAATSPTVLSNQDDEKLARVT